MANPFEFVNAAKVGNPSLEGYVYFTVTTLLSSSPKYLPICQMMNGLAFSRLPDDTKAKITSEILRKFNKEYFTYPKQAKKEKDSNNDDLLYIVKYLKCSVSEARLYYDRGYITDKDIKNIKETLR